MMFRKKLKTPAAAELFIKAAQQYLGYASGALGQNMFGQKVGYDSLPWSGAFIDVCAREAGLKLPSFAYTPAALAEFIRSGNFSRTPKLGSIAIFSFVTDSPGTVQFSMPHCGIVVDVREFSETGKFITVEGNTTGGGSYQNKDGVHQRIRTINEVTVFCHPKFDAAAAGKTFNERLIGLLDRGRTVFSGQEISTINEAARTPSLVKLDKEIKHGSRNKSVEAIQLALATVTDLRGCEPGKWDMVTAAAFARYQRMIGYVGKDASGLPEVSSIKRLAADTGLFRVND